MGSLIIYKLKFYILYLISYILESTNNTNSAILIVLQLSF
jgi:hypothetical protein